jgi:hypothetical protein
MFEICWCYIQGMTMTVLYVVRRDCKHLELMRSTLPRYIPIRKENEICATSPSYTVFLLFVCSLRRRRGMVLLLHAEGLTTEYRTLAREWAVVPPPFCWMEEGPRARRFGSPIQCKAGPSEEIRLTCPVPAHHHVDRSRSGPKPSFLLDRNKATHTC